MKQIAKFYLVILIIIFLGLLFQIRYIDEFPSFTHAWAQSDRYALSLGFVKNNLNFFKPQTFVMNHQFPGGLKVPPGNCITAVDFPIHDYIPAVFMKILGMNSPWIFRIYILVYSFIGLFYLFKLSYLKTNDILKSIFILIFAATSPVFVFYQSGFLPTIPSLSNAIIGIYFYLKYLNQKDKTDFWIGIVFLTLSILSRATFAIALCAILAVELMRLIRGEDKLKPKLIPVILSFLIIVSYQIYNNYLRETYGSIFLNHFLPATSFNEAKEIIKDVYKNWATQYFSTFHYLMLFSLFITSLFYIFKNKIKTTHENGQFWLLILTMFIGYFAFSVLMLKQFPAHDYYFLDTFFLPIVLLLIAIISYIPKLDVIYSNKYNPIFIILLCTPLIVNAVYSQKQRRITGNWDRTSATINNFKSSEAFLDSLKIKQNAKMIVIDAYAPNIPFILMNRKGYAIMNTSKENILSALKWDFDYIIVQNEFFVSDIYANYPEIVSKIKKIADNGKISVCILSADMTNQSLLGFMELENKIPVFERTMTFDTIVDNHWQNTQSTSKVYHSGGSSGYLNKDMTYGLSFKTKDLKVITEKSRVLLFSAYFLKDTLNDCEIVVAINSNGQGLYYKSFNLKEIIKNRNTWEKADLFFQLPHIASDDYEFGIYVWNTGKNNLYIDDFTFKIY